MLREDFQREVEDVFRAAAPRTMARRAACRHDVKAGQGGIAVSGHHNTVVVGAAAGKPARDDTLAQLLARIRPWSRLYARTYSVICALLLAVSLSDIYRDEGGILSLGLWVRANGISFLLRAVIAAALLAATIIGPYWLFTRLSRRGSA